MITVYPSLTVEEFVDKTHNSVEIIMRIMRVVVISTVLEHLKETVVVIKNNEKRF